MSVTSTDVLRVSAHLEWTTTEQDIINVMHMGLLAPSSLSDAQVLADVGEILELLYTDIRAFVSPGVTFVDYTVQNVSTTDAPQTTTWPTFTVGTGIGEALPPQTAALILTRCNVSRKQGRVYLGGLLEGNQAGGAWDAAILTALNLFGAQLVVGWTVSGGNYDYGVLSADVIGTPTQSNGWDVPISRRVIGNARTQRRRTLGFGS